MNLSFNGNVWVNAVTLLHDEGGSPRQTSISKGQKMTWPEFIAKYNSGELWEDEPCNIDLNGERLESGWTEYPHGALVMPERDNHSSQPVTKEQVYIVGHGLWQVRGNSDPSYFLWAYTTGSNPSYPINRKEFENVVEELDSAPVNLPLV